MEAQGNGDSAPGEPREMIIERRPRRGQSRRLSDVTTARLLFRETGVEGPRGIFQSWGLSFSRVSAKVRFFWESPWPTERSGSGCVAFAHEFPLTRASGAVLWQHPPLQLVLRLLAGLG